MLRMLRTRLRQGSRTMGYPGTLPPALPERFRGKLAIDPDRCRSGCTSCADVCPTSAIRTLPEMRIDLGRCLFCGECPAACPEHALAHTGEYRLAAAGRGDLVIGAPVRPAPARPAQAPAAAAGPDPASGGPPAALLDPKLRRLFRKSLSLRVVSAGGCNACEADTNVLTTIGWDIGRFGIQFVASPRHADGVLVTGPVTANMKLALEKTWAAVPSPKIVIAVGACAISGGPFAPRGPVEAKPAGLPSVASHEKLRAGDDPAGNRGVAPVLPVDLYIPGCPPHPLTILEALLRFLGRI